MTFRTLLETAVRKRPDGIAFNFKRAGEWRQLSYREFTLRVEALAEAAGTAFGLKPREDKVAFIIDNDVRWIEFYSALASVGITVVPMDHKLRAEEVAYILKDSGAAAVFTDAKHKELLEQILPELPSVRLVIYDEAGDQRGSELCGRPVRDYEEALAACFGKPHPFYIANAPVEQDIASIIYTSGTTGKPKGAMLTQNNFCSDASGCLDHIPEFGSSDSFLIVLPLFHSFSFTTNFVVPLTCQATMSFVENLRTVGEDIKTLKPTVLIAVPLLIDKLYQRIKEKIDASTMARVLMSIGLGKIVGKKAKQALGGALRLVIVGGAPCPQHVLRGLNALGIATTEGYGLTEASPVVTVAQFRKQRIGTIGTRIPNIEIRIAEPDAQGVGELQIRGPIVMKGYYNNVEATQASFDGPWLRTGDLASMDKEGYVTIRGRSKALIVNREGKNIYPEEVENCIARDPLVGDIVVVGYRENGETGERVGAILAPNVELFKTRNNGQDVPFDEMKAALEEIVKVSCKRLADYKHPRKIIVSAEPLERTATQKVRRCVYQGQLDT